MDFNISIGVALIIVFIASSYVIIKNRGLNQEGENQEVEHLERHIEFVTYKIEMDELEKQLIRKEISKDKYERLRKNVEEQHQKNLAQISKLRVK